MSFLKTIDKYGRKAWRDELGRLHNETGPAVEDFHGNKSWWLKDHWLGDNEEGFWNLWDRLTDEQKKNANLLSHLPLKDFSDK